MNLPLETRLIQYFEQAETLNMLQPEDLRLRRIARNWLRRISRHARR